MLIYFISPNISKLLFKRVNNMKIINGIFNIICFMLSLQSLMCILHFQGISVWNHHILGAQ